MKNTILILLATISLISGKVSANPFNDSLAKSNIDNNGIKSTFMVLVSAADLGFKDMKEVQWNTILDSAVSHGYSVCPKQTGLDLYMLLQYVSLGNMPSGRPVFVGMEEMKKGADKDKSYVYCMKAKGNGKTYKLAYANTTDSGKGFEVSATDRFVFVKER